MNYQLNTHNWRWGRPGQILVILLILLFVISFLILSLYSRLGVFLKSSTRSFTNDQAISLADGGADYAIRQLNLLGGSFTGTGAQPITLGTGQFTVSVASGFGTKTITSTGCIPSCSAAGAVKRTITVDATISLGPNLIGFIYAAQVTGGGVTLGAWSTVNGNLATNSAVTGSCPSTVNGIIYFFNTTISSPCPTYTSAIPLGAPLSLPDVGTANWKNTITAGATTNVPGGNFSDSAIHDYYGKHVTGILTGCGGTYVFGFTKLDSTLGLNCPGTKVLLKGPVWVVGDVTLRDEVRLDSTIFTNTGTVFITDRGINCLNCIVYPTTGSPKGFVLFISTLNNDPNASAFYWNNGTGGILYAATDDIQFVGTSNKPGAVYANQLSVYGTLSYDPDMANAVFTQGSWTPKRGTYR